VCGKFSGRFAQHGERRNVFLFSLAQAFTPGTNEATTPNTSPFQGLVLPLEPNRPQSQAIAESPLKGLEALDA
jgi:hypothetical protein